MTHTRDSLLAFSARVRAAFLAKQIRAPIHLNSDTQIEPLIDIFRDIRPQDYVFSTWRSSYHALLKGIPEEWVFGEILAGRSMYLLNAEHRFLSGSIVGGMLPLAAGVAAGIKRKQDWHPCMGGIGRVVYPNPDSQPKVFVFVGDMTARTGLYHEFKEYCRGQSLPVEIVVENNGLSTDTPTCAAWGMGEEYPTERHYRYVRTTPHVGVGERVQF